ncbi:hypothetical protein ACP70R_047970 [Stipagrostis hirtigluma subsp. patula]
MKVDLTHGAVPVMSQRFPDAPRVVGSPGAGGAAPLPPRAIRRPPLAAGPARWFAEPPRHGRRTLPRQRRPHPPRLLP